MRNDIVDGWWMIKTSYIHQHCIHWLRILIKQTKINLIGKFIEILIVKSKILAITK